MEGLAAGKLRHVIDIESQQRVFQNNTWVLDWVPEHEGVFAEVRPVSGKEFLQSQELQNAVDTEIRIRYRDPVDATMRVKHDGYTYEIESVLPDPYSGRQWLTLMTKRGVNDGS